MKFHHFYSLQLLLLLAFLSFVISTKDCSQHYPLPKFGSIVHTVDCTDGDFVYFKAGPYLPKLVNITIRLGSSTTLPNTIYFDKSERTGYASYPGKNYTPYLKKITSTTSLEIEVNSTSYIYIGIHLSRP